MKWLGPVLGWRSSWTKCLKNEAIIKVMFDVFGTIRSIISFHSDGMKVRDVGEATVLSYILRLMFFSEFFSISKKVMNANTFHNSMFLSSLWTFHQFLRFSQNFSPARKRGNILFFLLNFIRHSIVSSRVSGISLTCSSSIFGLFFFPKTSRLHRSTVSSFFHQKEEAPHSKSWFFRMKWLNRLAGLNIAVSPPVEYHVSGSPDPQPIAARIPGMTSRVLDKKSWRLCKNQDTVVKQKQIYCQFRKKNGSCPSIVFHVSLLCRNIRLNWRLTRTKNRIRNSKQKDSQPIETFN